MLKHDPEKWEPVFGKDHAQARGEPVRAAPLIIVGFACLALTAAAVAQDASRRRVEPQWRGPYFVEFRARGGGVLGHTYVLYGRIDQRGRAIDVTHAGLNPRDDYNDKPILAVALVPGSVTYKAEDPKKPTTAVYRRRLNAGQYAHLHATVHRLKATERAWHMTFYNCNDFAAQVAREMGMVAPFTWALPGTFVSNMRAINGP
jgi:hypothetical protein